MSNDTLTTLVAFRVTPAEKDLLARAAAQRDWSVSHFLRRLVFTALPEHAQILNEWPLYAENQKHGD